MSKLVKKVLDFFERWRWRKIAAMKYKFAGDAYIVILEMNGNGGRRLIWPMTKSVYKNLHREKAMECVLWEYGGPFPQEAFMFKDELKPLLIKLVTEQMGVEE